MGRKYYRRLNDDTWFEYDMWESGIVNPGTYYPMPLWLKIFFFCTSGCLRSGHHMDYHKGDDL